jgi:protocatechuate 3,4-dioxygenase beta subunit
MRIALLSLSTLLMIFAAPQGQKVTLTGKVTDESTKKPITDFHLLLRSGAMAETGETVIVKNVHNVRGTFTVLVPPGPLTLSVEAAGHLPAEQIVSGGGKAVTVALQAGVMLKGHVVGPDGKPVAKADVTVDYFAPASPGRKELHATTDANGNFSILSQPGEKTVRVTAEGLLLEERRVSVKKPGATVAEIQMVRPASVSGSVADDLGQPVAQARIRATLQNSNMHELKDATADAEGKFTIQPLRPGKYSLEATAPMHVPRKLESVDVPAAAPAQMRLDRGSLVRGFVRGSTDAERPYVSVYLGATVMTLINLKEEFGINAVPPGKVPVYAEVQQSGTVRRTPVVTIDTKNGGSTDVELSLQAAPVVSGTVKEGDQAVSRPVVVQFLQPNAAAFPPPMSVMTENDGSFHVVGISPGTYNVSVSGREVVSPKDVTVGIANTTLDINVKPMPRPANVPPGMRPPLPPVPHS